MPTCYITGYWPLALPLGELSPQATERALAVISPLRPRFARPPLPRGEAKGDARKGNPWRISISPRGKAPRKPKGFSWSVQGSLRGNRNPLRLVFFLPLFLLEKQKEKWDRTRKFAEEAQPSASFPQAKRISPISYPAAVSAAAVSASVVTSHVPSSQSVGS